MMADCNFKKFESLLWDVEPIPKKQRKQLEKDVEATKNSITIDTGWRACLYWVVRLEWAGKKLKSPVNRSITQAYELHGRLMHAVLRLCKDAHPHQDKRWGYDSWLDWFSEIVKEAVKASKNLEEKSKTRKIQQQREYLHLLDDLKNPYNCKTEPHLWRLIQTWVTKQGLRESVPQESCWIPFKRSFSRRITELDGPDWGCLFEEKNETRIIQEGKKKICEKAKLKVIQGRGHRPLLLAETVTIRNIKS